MWCCRSCRKVVRATPHIHVLGVVQWRLVYGTVAPSPNILRVIIVQHHPLGWCPFLCWYGSWICITKQANSRKININSCDSWLELDSINPPRLNAFMRTYDEEILNHNLMESLANGRLRRLYKFRTDDGTSSNVGGTTYNDVSNRFDCHRWKLPSIAKPLAL